MAKQFRFLLSIIMLAMMGSGALAATNYSALMTSNMGLSTADQGFSNNYGTATKVLRSNSVIRSDAFLAERVNISSTTRPKYAGVATLTVPAGTKKVHFHAVGYAGGAKPDLRVNLQGSSNILLRDSLPLDPGFASTTATYYELQLSPTSAYYSITFSTIPQEDVQLVFLSTNAVRFLLYGVNAEPSKVYKLNYYNGDSQVASTFTQTGSNKYTLSANPYPAMGMWLTLEYNNQQTIYALVGDNATLNRYNSTNVQLKANGADWKVPEHQNADLTFTIDDSGSAPVLSITGWPEPTLYLDSDRESSNQILNVDEPLQKDASGLYTRVVTVPESFIDTFCFSLRDEDYTYFGASDYPDVTESNFGEEVEMYPGGPGRITVFPRGTFKITLDASNLLAVKVKVEQYVPDSYRISADQGTGSAEFFNMEQREDGTFYSQVTVSGDHMDMQVLDQNGNTYGTISDEPDGVQGKTVQLGIAGTVDTWVMRISAPGTYDVVLDPATMTLSVQEVAKKYFIQQHQPTGEDLEMTKNGDIYYKRIVLPGDYYLFQLMDENGHTIAVTTEADGVGIQGKTIQVSNDSEVLKYMMSVTEPGPSIFYVKFIPSTMQLSVPLADTYWLSSDTQAGTELLAGNMVKQADGTYTKTFTVTQEFLDANNSLAFSIGDNCDGVFGYNGDDNIVTDGVSNMQLEELGQKRLVITEADTYTVTFDPVTLLVSVAKGNPGKKYYLVVNDDVSNKKELTFSSQIGEGSYSYELDETMYLPEGVTFYVLDEAGTKIGHPGESVYALPPNAASWVAPGDASLTIEEPGLYKLGLFALASGDYNFVTNKQKYYWTNTEEELTYDPERQAFVITKDFPDATFDMQFWIQDASGNVFNHSGGYYDITADGCVDIPVTSAITGNANFRMTEEGRWTIIFKVTDNGMTLSAEKYQPKFYLVMNNDQANKLEFKFDYVEESSGMTSYQLAETIYLQNSDRFYVLDDAGNKISGDFDGVMSLGESSTAQVGYGNGDLTVNVPGLYVLRFLVLEDGSFNLASLRQRYYLNNSEEEFVYDPERQGFVITKTFPDAVYDMQFWIQDFDGIIFGHPGSYGDITDDYCVDLPVERAYSSGNASNFRMTEPGTYTIIFKVSSNGMTLSVEKYQPKFYLVMNNDQANKLEFKFDYVEESSGMTSYQLAETIYLQNSDRFYVLDDAGNKISGDFDGVMSLGESSTAQVGYGNGDLTVNVPGLYVLRFLVLEDGSFNLASLRQRYYLNNSEEEFVYDPERQGFVITKTFPDAVYDMQFWIQDFDGIIFGHPGSYGDITDDYCVDLPVERAYSSGNASNFRMTEAGTYTIIFKVSSNGKTLSVEKYQPKYYLVLNNDEANKIELIADGENLFKAADAVYIPKGAPIYLLDGAGNKMGVGIEGYTHPEEATNGGSRMQEGGFAFSLQRPGFYEVQYRIENEIPWFEWLEVEKQFYVVGDMNNWSLDSFIPMTRNEQTGAYEYEFTVGSDVSQYYFTITDVNNGTWDIPHYGIAPSTGGEEANLLTADNPTVQLQKFTDGSLKIASPGTYKLSLDPATMQLTVSGWPKSYYVWIPSTDGWSYDKSQLRELTYNAQTNAYELEVNQDVSWMLFYLLDAQVDDFWSGAGEHRYGAVGNSGSDSFEFMPESSSVSVAPSTSPNAFATPMAGNYKISLNAETMELSVSGYQQFYADVINNSWTDLDSVVELVFNKSTATYEGEVEIAFEGGNTWKHMLITDGPHSTFGEMLNHTRYAPLANYTYDASNNTVQMGPNGDGGKVVFAQEGKFKLSLAVTGPNGNLTYTLTITEVVQPTDIDALANAIYVEQVEGVPGGTAQLDIQMKNADYTPVGCTFDIVLPEGFSLATDDAGEIIYTLGDRASRMNAIVVANSNNTYNVALQPASGTAVISDTEGTILSFTLQIPEDAAIGEYAVKLERNLIQYKPAGGGATKDAVLSNVTAICQVDDFMLGDVNGDRQITPTDATMILMYYFNIPQTGFIVRAADVTQDGNISPADSVEDLLIFFGSAAGAKQAPAFELDEEEIMKDPE